MADPKKNPLLGAFRAPPTEDKPPAGPATTPPKPAEEKKPTEPPKETAPVKGDTPPWEDKAPAAPGKPGEEKKPTEPPKAPEGQKPGDQGKEAKGDKAPAAPDKPSEEKKPAEPPKAPEGEKSGDKGKETKGGKTPAAPGKPAEEKKPAEPPKAPEGQKPGDQGKEIPDDFHEDIVSTEKMETETMLPVDLIDSFEDHPYSVKDNEDMAELVKSIKESGLLEAVTVIRNPKRQGRFEMVSGHRRLHAAKLAGLTHIRSIVRVMDRDAAIIAMVDSNLKRKEVSPMEKARAYQMKSDAMRRKAGRRSKAEIAAIEATGKKPLTVDQELAQKAGESVATVQRYKALNKLNEPLQKMVDKGKLPVNTAADIAQMKPEEQDKLADAIKKEGGTVPSGTKAKELKEASKAGTLTEKKIEAAVAPTKREVEPPLKVTLMEEDLLPYFPKGTTVPDVKKGIFEGLEVRKKLIERQKAKAKEEKGGKKKPPSPAR